MRKPESVCVSIAVIMVLPSAWLMLVTVTVAVKLPVADAGVDALAMGTRKTKENSNGSKGFRFLVVRVSLTNVLLFMALSMLGSDLVIR